VLGQITTGLTVVTISQPVIGMDKEMQKCDTLGHVYCVVTLANAAIAAIFKIFDFLNHYGVAFSVLFGAASLWMTWHYKQKHYELALAKNGAKCEEDNG
jgi:hypothetical protein